MENAIKVGDKFSTFMHLKTNIQVYEQKNFVRFHICEQETLAKAKPKLTKKQESFTNKHLKFYELKYCCVQGGMSFQEKKDNKGVLPTDTSNQDCKAFIFLKLTEDGNHLVVTDMSSVHNHDVSKELYNKPSYKRKLESSKECEAPKLLKLQENKVVVESDILLDTSDVARALETKYGVKIRMSVNEEMNMTGLFIQDEEMRKCYDAYPEILLVDSTSKLLDLQVPITVLMVEDPNGQNEVAAIGVLVSEGVETLNWFLDMFKQLNPAWERTRVLSTDMVTKERLVFSQQFPAASHIICVSHAVKAFGATVSCARFGITEGQQNLYIDIHQRMALAKTKASYSALYEHLQKVAIKEVLDYFNANWHPIRRCWTMGTQFITGNFIQSTNSWAEAFNTWIMTVVKVYSTLDTFVDNLFVALNRMRQDRKQEVPALEVSKICTTTQKSYSQLLTPYAYRYVAAELGAPKGIKPTQGEGDRFIIESASGASWSANDNSCTCMLHKNVHLPCRHIFAVRVLRGLNLFDASLCAKRWTRIIQDGAAKGGDSIPIQNGTAGGGDSIPVQNGTAGGGDSIPIQNGTVRGGDSIAVQNGIARGGDSIYVHCKVVRPAVVTNPIEGVPKLELNIVKPRRTFSEQERKNVAKLVTSELANVVAEVSGVQFERRIEILKRISSAWKTGDEVVLPNS